MEELKATIAKLEKPDERIVEVLQEIGTMLLSEYVLQIGDITVEPLWVEAYYANNDKGFSDPFIHGDEKQKESGVLYFHHKTDDSRSGVDICLGKEDDKNSYLLSYLLKYTLVDGVFTTQSQLSGKIRKAYEALPPDSKCSVIKKQHHPADVIGYTERRGLKVKDTDKDAARKKEYAAYKLAIVRDFCQTYPTTATLPQKEKLVDDYLSRNEVNKEKWCKEHLKYCPKRYKGK